MEYKHEKKTGKCIGNMWRNVIFMNFLVPSSLAFLHWGVEMIFALRCVLMPVDLAWKGEPSTGSKASTTPHDARTSVSFLIEPSPDSPEPVLQLCNAASKTVDVLGQVLLSSSQTRPRGTSSQWAQPPVDLGPTQSSLWSWLQSRVTTDCVIVKCSINCLLNWLYQIRVRTLSLFGWIVITLWSPCRFIQCHHQVKALMYSALHTMCAYITTFLPPAVVFNANQQMCVSWNASRNMNMQ